MNEIIIIGAGGHAKVIADIVVKTGNILIGFLDDNESTPKKVLGFNYLGEIENCREYINIAEFVIGIGNNRIRQMISEKFDLEYTTLIHPSAQIGLNVKLGIGTVVMANAVLNSNTYIGEHCIVNTGAIIEHDNVIEDFVHISPNAVLGGTVKVGMKTHIGIGATVKNNISICGDCTIGAGGVVVKNITESGTYIGIPTKRM